MYSRWRSRRARSMAMPQLRFQSRGQGGHVFRGREAVPRVRPPRGWIRPGCSPGLGPGPGSPPRYCRRIPRGWEGIRPRWPGFPAPALRPVSNPGTPRAPGPRPWPGSSNSSRNGPTPEDAQGMGGFQILGQPGIGFQRQIGALGPRQAGRRTARRAAAHARPSGPSARHAAGHR